MKAEIKSFPASTQTPLRNEYHRRYKPFRARRRRARNGKSNYIETQFLSADGNFPMQGATGRALVWPAFRSYAGGVI